MAAKRKTSKKPAKSPAKKHSGKKKPLKSKPAKKTAVSKRKVAKQPASQKRRQKQSALEKKKVAVKRPRPRLSAERVAFPPAESPARSAGQSGDLQGLSGIAEADSESVDELIEEGNAFEADVVSGVEEAGDDEEKEVRTHEVPEDDVPDEYLNED